MLAMGLSVSSLHGGNTYIFMPKGEEGLILRIMIISIVEKYVDEVLIMMMVSQ